MTSEYLVMNDLGDEVARFASCAEAWHCVELMNEAYPGVAFYVVEV